MYQVTKRFNPGKGYSCAFRNWRAASHCRFIHGYDLIFDVTFEGPVLDECNWLIDFGGLVDVKVYLDAIFDHKLIVAYDDPERDAICQLAGLGVADVVELVDVGCEAFARLVANHTQQWLSYTPRVTGLRVASVTVHENEANSAKVIF